ATRKVAAERYPSVLALANDLRCFVRDEPVSVYVEGPARRLVRAAARRPALATGVLAGIVLAAAVLVISSLAKSASEASRRAHDVEGSRRVLVAVGRRVQEIDVKLSDLAAGLQAIAGAAVESLELDGGLAPFKPAPELKPSAAYGGAGESFEQAVAEWPGMEAGEPVPASAQKLLGIERWYRRALFEALSAKDRRASEAERKQALFDGRGMLMRCFVGLEDGSFAQYPARAVAHRFDPRERPWYQMGKSNMELVWRHPVIDVAKTTLRMPVTVGLTGSNSQFVGVAGCELRVANLSHELALDLPGFRRAYLVGEDGRILVAEGLEAQLLAATHDVNALPAMPEIDDKALLEHLKAGEQGGYLLGAGGKLTVFARMISPAWTYVVELDSAPYLSR
ncbi:MAG TPA: cache domain-containing protein, partial [Polyangiaceae bacterium]|nr:cache domain-containing protein [Polyangiaceae bacterium]